MDRNILLIVDDVELNRMLLRNVFEEEYNILEAENGEQALFLIKQYQDSIAAILLDIVMPVKDGYEVLENMKQAQLTDKLPVIVVTSRDSSDDEVLAFDLGAVDIVSKPFEPHVVSRRVHNAVELSQNREHLEQMCIRDSIMPCMRSGKCSKEPLFQFFFRQCFPRIRCHHLYLLVLLISEPA